MAFSTLTETQASPLQLPRRQSPTDSSGSGNSPKSQGPSDGSSHGTPPAPPLSGKLNADLIGAYHQSIGLTTDVAAIVNRISNAIVKDLAEGAAFNAVRELRLVKIDQLSNPLGLANILVGALTHTNAVQISPQLKTDIARIIVGLVAKTHGDFAGGGAIATMDRGALKTAMERATESLNRPEDVEALGWIKLALDGFNALPADNSAVVATAVVGVFSFIAAAATGSFDGASGMSSVTAISDLVSRYFSGTRFGKAIELLGLARVASKPVEGVDTPMQALQSKVGKYAKDDWTLAALGIQLLKEIALNPALSPEDRILAFEGDLRPFTGVAKFVEFNDYFFKSSGNPEVRAVALFALIELGVPSTTYDGQFAPKATELLNARAGKEEDPVPSRILATRDLIAAKKALATMKWAERKSELESKTEAIQSDIARLSSQATWINQKNEAWLRHVTAEVTKGRQEADIRAQYQTDMLNDMKRQLVGLRAIADREGNGKPGYGTLTTAMDAALGQINAKLDVLLAVSREMNAKLDALLAKSQKSPSQQMEDRMRVGKCLLGTVSVPEWKDKTLDDLRRIGRGIKYEQLLHHVTFQDMYKPGDFSGNFSEFFLNDVLKEIVELEQSGKVDPLASLERHLIAYAANNRMTDERFAILQELISLNPNFTAQSHPLDMSLYLYVDGTRKRDAALLEAALKMRQDALQKAEKADDIWVARNMETLSKNYGFAKGDFATQLRYIQGSIAIRNRLNAENPGSVSKYEMGFALQNLAAAYLGLRQPELAYQPALDAVNLSWDRGVYKSKSEIPSNVATTFGRFKDVLEALGRLGEFMPLVVALEAPRV